MLKTLLLNTFSANTEFFIAKCAEDGKTALLTFYKTIQTAIKDHGFEKYIISDRNFWELDPSEGCTLTEFIISLSPTEQRWIYELHRLASKTTTDFFSEDIIERVLAFSPVLRDRGGVVYPLGCAACVTGVVAVSFSVDEFWNNPVVFLDWCDGAEIIPHQEFDLGESVPNVSDPSHISIALSHFPAEEKQITRGYWSSVLPTTDPQESFWTWFDTLSSSVQKSLFKVIQTIQERRWLARKMSSFQKLVGNELCEVRCWPDGGPTIRVYVKVETQCRVVFLNGSVKKDQDAEIDRAIELYAEYKKNR